MIKRVAIIGMAFRFPGTSYERYWTDLLEGRDLVTEVDPSRWALDTYRHPDKKHPGTSYSFAAGSLGDVSGFDAGFFGISPREAAMMDPQQRLLLEMSWEACESAGVPPTALRGSRCGVYIGIASTDYSSRLADDLAAIDGTVATGNTSSIAANRISYVMDLRGPSMAIDTACSSSMVAFHQACRSISSGETTHALAGGISLHLHPYGFITFSKASMLSRAGRCRVFDAAGDGYVRSEGGGVFLLKDYDQALADGDPVLAVVAHSAVNTDGRKSGLTVPQSRVQAALLREAYASAGIDPATVDYVEAHGTGTPVGDPVETRAIGEAIGQLRPAGQPLPIGSVKTNMGHLEAASGVAGLVKAIHCLQHRIVPATVGFETPNPAIDFTGLNVAVVAKNTPLKASGRLVIGVNSFGFGGANAHVILESHSRPAGTVRPRQSPHALPVLVSGRSAEALRAAAGALADRLDQPDIGALYDVAHASLFRRDWHEHRALVWGDSPSAVAHDLRAFGLVQPSAEIPSVGPLNVAVVPAGPTPRLALLYSGNGSQWLGMGRQLLLDSPVFAAAIAEIDSHFLPLAGYRLHDDLAGTQPDTDYARTELAQPALFALQVGVTCMLRAIGLHADAFAGHSVGEVAAAWASGALSLAQAVEVIFHRSRLQGRTRGDGGMSAVSLGESDAQEWITKLGLQRELTVAARNSIQGVTLAGALEALGRLEIALEGAGVFYKRLDLDYAFHSPAMDRIHSDLGDALQGLSPRHGDAAFYSTVTGTRLDGQALDASYWWKNIREPVHYADAVSALIADQCTLFLEVGPHPVLRNYTRDALKLADCAGQVIPTLSRKGATGVQVQGAASQVILAGAEIDWSRLFPIRAAALPLPFYPWQRERHWHPMTATGIGLLERHVVHPLLGFAVRQQALTWENSIDTQRLPELADHGVGGATPFPGTGFAELALAAALAWQPAAHVTIEDLEIRSPLLVSTDSAVRLRTRIDAHDGSVRMEACPEHGDESWTLHAVARILREAQRAEGPEAGPPHPARAPDFDSAQHGALTQAAGLQYGQAFQRIARGWVLDADTALAVFSDEPVPAHSATPGGMPSTTCLDGCHLHPAVLDCTLQLIVHLLDAGLPRQPGIAYVPSRLARFSFCSAAGRPHHAVARILRRSAQALQAEFQVFDIDGHVIAALHEVRFRSIRLNKTAAERLSFLDEHAIPCPHPAQGRDALALELEQVRLALGEASRRCALKHLHLRYTSEVEPLLDALCARFSGELTDDVPAADIWNALVADYPDYFPVVHAVGRIGLHRNALLAGQRSLVDTLPRETTLASLLHHVVGVEAREALAYSLGDTLAQAQLRLPAGQRLTILEISAGGALFAAELSRHLDFNRADYCFASASADALAAAADLHEACPQLHCCLLEGGGAALPQAQQLILLSLDFPTLQESRSALQQARQCLAPGGTLVLLAQHPTSWINFVFGQRLDSELAGQPLQQTAGDWQADLLALGLDPVSTFELSPDVLSGPYLMLASRAVEVSPVALAASDRPRVWLVQADPQGASVALAEELARALQRKGHLVVHTDARERVALESLLRDCQQKFNGVDGVALLGGGDARDPRLTHAQRAQAQRSRCATLAALVQACEATGVATTCWVVTQNAARALMKGLSLSEVAQPAMASTDAAVWGFARALGNEPGLCVPRLIDLDQDLDGLSAPDAMAREVCEEDGELEVILTGAGARYVPRLQVQPRAAHTALAGSSDWVALSFEFPGQLRNLRWEARTAPILAPEDIDVEIRATGLNFRDVMYALGMLSDEAVENGFAGPTLGLEFAGIVRRVGANVKGYAPGDAVVGFGPSSFGTRTLTQASAIGPIPRGLSFEAAATIPSTFFTVYYALHHLANLAAGERILIHGAAGGVGIAAIQLAKWLGAEIHASAGSDEKRDFLRLLGVDYIYDSRSLAFADQVLANTGGEGVDVVLNSLAGEAIHRNLSILKPFGRFLELGKRDFYENTRIGLRPFRNNISYFGIDADQLMRVRPDLTRRLFGELMTLFTDGVLHPLPYRVFEANQVVDAFRYMQQAKQIGKVVVTYYNGIGQIHQPRGMQERTLQLDSQAAYLVTGGLGGFGLRTAQWLVDHGARHLVLISRSGPRAVEAQAALTHWHAAGIAVQAEACDVSDEKSLRALLARLQAASVPLRGIIHAATVIEDGLVRNLTPPKIAEAFAAKAQGAELLDALTRDCALDFFVLFSSATTLFGNPGQSSYVAANCVIEALARSRRAAGQPATCVRWGAIDDVGFLARNTAIKDALQGRMGGHALRAEVALNALETLMLADVSGVGVLELDWRALSRFLPTAASPRFSELAQGSSEAESHDEQGQDIGQLLLELNADEAHAHTLGLLKIEVSEILRVAPDKIDAQRSIYDMGLDSLMGVELVLALENRFGLRLPVMALSQTPTLDKLAERLLDMLRTRSREGAAAEVPAANTQVQQALRDQTQVVLGQHGDQFSAADVSSMAHALESARGTQSSRIIH